MPLDPSGVPAFGNGMSVTPTREHTAYGRFPESNFPRKTFPEKTFSGKLTSPGNVFPGNVLRGK